MSIRNLIITSQSLKEEKMSTKSSGSLPKKTEDVGTCNSVMATRNKTSRSSLLLMKRALKSSW